MDMTSSPYAVLSEHCQIPVWGVTQSSLFLGAEFGPVQFPPSTWCMRIMAQRERIGGFKVFQDTSRHGPDSLIE